MGGSVKWPYNDSECLDADFFKVVADTLVKESGIRPLLHTTIVEVIMDEEKKTVKGVITESKSGRQAILAQLRERLGMSRPKYQSDAPSNLTLRK